MSKTGVFLAHTSGGDSESPTTTTRATLAMGTPSTTRTNALEDFALLLSPTALETDVGLTTVSAFVDRDDNPFILGFVKVHTWGLKAGSWGLKAGGDVVYHDFTHGGVEYVVRVPHDLCGRLAVVSLIDVYVSC